MNFIKRAFLSTKVKKGRSLLLILVFSAILIFILAGLIIQNASLRAIENATKSTGATVTLSTNIRNAFQPPEDFETEEEQGRGRFNLSPVSLDIADELANLDHVASYNYISTTSAYAKSFEAVTSSTTETEQSESRGFGGPGGRMGGINQGDVSISGTSSTETLSTFTDGTNTIIDGKGLTIDDIDSHNALIEANLAEANGLAVGDAVQITGLEDEETMVELTIIGIYESTATVDSRMMQISALNPSNTIYTSYTLANSLKGEDYLNTADSVIYTLTDPEKIEQFVEDAKAAGINTETYTLQTNDLMYQQMLQPIENVGDFAQKIVILVSASGVVILSLIIMLMIRERKHEIGVLLSLGEKRTKVVSQFIVEMLIVLVVALSIAGLSGKYVGNVIGEQLLAQENEPTSTPVAGPDNRGFEPRGIGPGSFGNFGASSQQAAEQIEELDISISLGELVRLGGFGLAITFISIMIASIGIMRMQPKKILIS